MTIDSNSSQPNSPTPETSSPRDLPSEPLDKTSNNDISPVYVATGQEQTTTSQQSSAKAIEVHNSTLTQRSAKKSSDDSRAPAQNRLVAKLGTASNRTAEPRISLIILGAIALVFLGIALDSFLIGLLGTLLALLLSLFVLWPWWQAVLTEMLSPRERSLLVAVLGMVVAIIGLFQFTGVNHRILTWSTRLDWGAIGALGEVIGAVGQILIAVVAVYVAWRQYIISKELTTQQNLLIIQQNLITQQQTIDTYFQGISELVLDEQGLLEDWPQERAIAEARTAAILSSVDAGGKAKIIRFLSDSKLLTPLKRDQRLGRAILNGFGGYEEDRLYGVRVIHLEAMLAGADLSATDLGGADLSEINLIRANLSYCNLAKANLSRTILYNAQLVGTDFKGVLMFYGSAETATPRSQTELPNYETGVHTGAVIENANFTNVQRLSDPVRYYCCAWGGSRTRATIPGGCEGIPDKIKSQVASRK